MRAMTFCQDRLMLKMLWKQKLSAHSILAQLKSSYFRLFKDCMYTVLIHEQTVILERLGKDVGNLSKAQRLSQCHCHVLRGLWR